MEKGRRLPAWAFAIPPAVALCLFTVYFLQIRNEPFARYLVANPFVYDAEAKRILAGESYGMPFFMSALYPGFIALIYKLVRPDHLLVPVAQGVLLALNTLLLGLASRRLLGDTAGLVASFVMTFYWSFYYFAGEMVPVTLLLTFILLALLLFLDREERRRPAYILGGVVFAAVLFIMRGLPGLANPAGGDAHLASFLLAIVFTAGAAMLLVAVLAVGRLGNVANLAGSGLLLGTACLVWGAAAVLAVPFILVLLTGGAAGAVRTGIRWRGAAVFILALGIPLAAGFLHNYVASGERVLLTTSTGVNLFIGNNPDSDGMDPFRLGENDSVRQEADRLRLTASSRSRFYAGHAYEYIRENPLDWLRLIGRKALLSVSKVEIDNNADISERRAAWRRFPVPVLHFGILFPLALAGIVAAFRRRGDLRLAVWGFLCFAAVCIVFFVCERFRVPGVVFLIPLAVMGAFHLLRGLAGGVKGIALALLLVLLGAAVSNIDFLAIADYEFPSITVNKALAERLDGDFEKARHLAHLAISREPGNAGAHFQLGAMEEAEGDETAAMQYYLESLERDAYYVTSYRAASRMLERAGISTSYLDRYIEMRIRKEDAGELKRQIVGFMEARADE